MFNFVLMRIQNTEYRIQYSVNLLNEFNITKKITNENSHRFADFNCNKGFSQIISVNLQNKILKVYVLC